MRPDTPIDADTPCVQCGYNLRGLAVAARCPECGHPALRAVLRATVAADGRERDGLHVVRRATELLARLLRRNVDSVRFVRNACLTAIARERNATSPTGVPRAADARAICDHLRDLAVRHYLSRDEALATFRFWRIERSEDVGEIVFGMIEIGLLAPSKDDSPADFHGLFTLKEWWADNSRSSAE